MGSECVYIDATTNERIGYLYRNGMYSCAVTEGFAREHGLEDAEILPYLSLPNEVLCVKEENSDRLYHIADAIWSYEDGLWHNLLSRVEDTRDWYDCAYDEVEVCGCIYKRDICTVLDNEYALQRMLMGVEL